MESKLLKSVFFNSNDIARVRIDKQYMYYINYDNRNVYVFNKNSNEKYKLKFDLFNAYHLLSNKPYDICQYYFLDAIFWISDSLVYMMLYSVIYIFDNKKLKSKIVIPNLQNSNHNFIIANEYIYLFDYNSYVFITRQHIIDLQIIVINIHNGCIKNIIKFDLLYGIMYFDYVKLDYLLRYTIARYNNGFSWTYGSGDMTYEIKIVDDFFYDRPLNSV